MPPTQTTAPSMCSAKASAAMSGPVRGMIKRYYSGYTLAYASYGKEGLSSVRASSSQRLLMALYVRRAPNPQCLAARAPDTDRKAVDDSYTWHKGGVHLYQARRTRHPGASCDSENWTWQLPRLCVVDDRSGPLARFRGPFRFGLSACSLVRARICRRWLDPRVVPSVSAGRRLGRI